LETRPVGKIPVEQGKVVAGGAKLDVGLERGMGNVNGMAIASQSAGDRIRKIGFVFDYE
jgi:hypothetical protein